MDGLMTLRPEPNGMTPTHLRVRNLKKEFVLHILRGKQILGFEDVSFDVPAGGFVGIAGHSGSGKSSLLKCLYRTYLADSGSVFIDLPGGESIDLVTAPDDVILDLRVMEIGYVSQFLRPAPRVSALDLAARPLLRQGFARSDAYERVAHFFRQLALPEDLWDGYPILFSGGEQQRVNLARALASDSKLLLLDEPTSALDASLQAEVVRLLTERRDRGTTMIGIMHDLDLLNQLSDVVVHMDAGRVLGVEANGDRLQAPAGVWGDVVATV
jgi:alpha-D-ribose 1-methylphosphonate 5-triphosphate synthase subunit PhnL